MLAMDKSLEPIGQRRCTKPVLIRIPECQNTFYNYTGMPNLVEQDTQFEARHQLQTFEPLITHKCSNKLNFFLCSVYTPMCDVNTRHLIGPCRPLCEHVRSRCAPVLRVFQFEWPDNLNCSRFPLKNVEGGPMCMEGPQDSDENSILLLNHHPNLIDLQDRPTQTERVEETNKEHLGIRGEPLVNMIEHEVDEKAVAAWLHRLAKLHLTANRQYDQTVPDPASVILLTQAFRHCSHMKKTSAYIYLNSTGRCAPKCDVNIQFNPNAKRLAFIWTAVLTTLCVLFTAPTLILYAIDSKIFCTFERPVIYIALCQLLFSSGYIISLGLGRRAVTCAKDLDSTKDIRLQEGLDNSACALVFMIHYFFTIASTLWWSVMTVQWAQYHVRLTNNMINEHLNTRWYDVVHSKASNPSVDRNANLIRLKNQLTTNGVHTSQGQADLNAKQFQEESTRKPSQTHSRGQDGKLYRLRQPGSFQTGVVYSTNRFFNSTKTMSERLSVRLAREHAFVWITSGLLTVIVLVTKNVSCQFNRQIALKIIRKIAMIWRVCCVHSCRYRRAPEIVCCDSFPLRH